MLTPHRRHQKSCDHREKGWNYTLCSCPIWADGRLDGRRFQRSLHTTNWERALLRIAKLDRGEDVDFIETKPTGRLLDTAINAYLADAEIRNLKRSTLRIYNRTLGYLSDALGSIAISDVRLEHLSKFRAGRKVKPRTQRKEIEVLRAFCAFCVANKWMTDNPAKALKAPKVDDVATMSYTTEEVDRLLMAAEQMRGMWKFDTPGIRKRTRALVLTLLYSGLRIGDVAQLKRSALEPSRHLVLRTMKTGVPMKILLNAEAANALNALPAPGGNPTYFFWTGNGDVDDCAKSLGRTILRLGRMAKVHAYPHRFRDHFAVTLLTNGADIRTVQQLLGHESIRTTEKHYAHFVAAHQAALDRAASTLDFRPKTAGPLLVSSLKK